MFTVSSEVLLTQKLMPTISRWTYSSFSRTVLQHIVPESQLSYYANRHQASSRRIVAAHQSWS